eukprot:XP_014790641.1 PREDICTED: salivary glue protein Sgs-3-like [Octopus bimaculoides]
MKVWDYKNQIRPKVRHENIPIVFLCDDSRWPFNNNTNTTTTTTSPSTRATTTTSTTTTTASSTTTSTRIQTTAKLTTTPPTTTPSATTASTTTHVYWPRKCYINQECVIAKGCNCISMDKQPCLQKCSHYALCIQGIYTVSSCGYGRRFEPSLRRCISGRCPY